MRKLFRVSGVLHQPVHGWFVAEDEADATRQAVEEPHLLQEDACQPDGLDVQAVRPATLEDYDAICGVRDDDHEDLHAVELLMLRELCRTNLHAFDLVLA